jgi:hypothetical protein
MVRLLAATPALPLHEAGKYVAAAYVVFVVLLLIYVGIMAAKLQRIERELRDLARFAEQGAPNPGMPGRAARRSDRPSQSDSSGGSEAAAGKSEDMPGIDSAQPATGSDRNLTPSGPVAGPADQARGVRDV